MEQIYRIGIDHGYGNIKSAHHIFQLGVVQKYTDKSLRNPKLGICSSSKGVGNTWQQVFVGVEEVRLLIC